VTRAAIGITVAPNPITATTSVQLGFSWSIRFTVTITETAGLGGDVQLVSAALFDDVTGKQVAANLYDDKDLVVFVGKKRIEPKGSLDVTMQLDYAIPNDATAKAADLTVVVQFKDDKGNLLTQSVLIKVV
jgi:hypothetical protein